MLKTRNRGKFNFLKLKHIFSLTWMKVINKYWDSDLCLTKIKVNEKMKQIGFD